MSDTALRNVLVALAAYHLGLGALMAIDPGTFFDEIGRYGVRNDHYIGDIASFQLAVGIGFANAAMRPSWRVPVLGLVAIWYGLHALNHLLDIGEARTDARGAFDTVALAVGALLLAWLARIAGRGTGAR